MRTRGAVDDDVYVMGLALTLLAAVGVGSLFSGCSKPSTGYVYKKEVIPAGWDLDTRGPFTDRLVWVGATYYVTFIWEYPGGATEMDKRQLRKEAYEKFEEGQTIDLTIRE